MALLVLWPQATAAAGGPPAAALGPIISVLLSDTGVTADSETVRTEAGVTTITAAGIYSLAGSLTDGRVVVDASDESAVWLVLDSVDITSTTGAPIQVAAADEVVLMLPDGSTSALSRSTPLPEPAHPVGVAGPAIEGDPGPEPEPEPGPETGAAVQSTADLTITGAGSLAVDSADHDGITSADGLAIDSGTITVNARGDGLRGDDFVRVNSGTITVNAAGTGLTATNSVNPTMGFIDIHGGMITIDSGLDSIEACGAITIAGGTLTLTSGIANKGDAIHSDTTLDVLAGSITVVEAYEGLEALKLSIRGGTVTVTTSNDGLNAAEDGLEDYVLSPNAFIHIEGGTIAIEAGDDGIDSNGTITVTGGETVVSAAFDGIDSNGSFTMSDGTVVVNGAPVNDSFQDGLEALGGLFLSGGTLLSAAISASYTPPAPASTQGWLSVKLDAPQPAGTIVHLVSETTVIASYRGAKQFQSMVFSSRAIANRQDYDVYLGGEVSGEGLGGLYAQGDLTDATKVATVSAGRFTW